MEKNSKQKFLLIILSTITLCFIIVSIYLYQASKVKSEEIVNPANFPVQKDEEKNTNQNVFSILLSGKISDSIGFGALNSQELERANSILNYFDYNLGKTEIKVEIKALNCQKDYQSWQGNINYQLKSINQENKEVIKSNAEPLVLNFTNNKLNHNIHLRFATLEAEGEIVENTMYLKLKFPLMPIMNLKGQIEPETRKCSN